MSAQIRQERADYYDILERTQKATMDITPWMDWFLQCPGRAIYGAEVPSEPCPPKRAFGKPLGTVLNERQRLVVNRLLDGFEAKLTTMKYGKPTQCSHGTALRDLAALVERSILVRIPKVDAAQATRLPKSPESLGESRF
jgi:Fic family protein